ncbi:MAG: hypothetical protein PHN66_03460 [Candidatus Shapirobacteria bacterium]|nr:hypothetical protein [Candidatus Shapirobacteria bacterium]
MNDLFGLTVSYREKTSLIEFLEETFPNDFVIYEEKKENQEWLTFNCFWKDNKGTIKINLRTGDLDKESTTHFFFKKIKEQMRKTS